MTRISNNQYKYNWTLNKFVVFNGFNYEIQKWIINGMIIYNIKNYA